MTFVVRALTRLLGAVGALAGLSVLIFVAMNYKSPADIARAALGRSATTDQLRAYASAQGLDDPVMVRYLRWVGGFLRGDLGTSPVTSRPVAETILPELGRTMTLAALGATLGIAIALWIGVALGRRAGTSADFAVLTGSVVIAATPEFVVGIVLLVLFGVWLGWLPVESGSAFSFGTWTDQAAALILPALTVALIVIPHLYRFVRSSVREGVRAAHTEGAELRGLSPRTVKWDYVLRNSAGPIINAAAMNVVFAVGGLVAVEAVMSFPGIGGRMVSAIGQGDAITTQAIAIILAAIILAVFLAADLLTLAMNPRLRLKR